MSAALASCLGLDRGAPPEPRANGDASASGGDTAAGGGEPDCPAGQVRFEGVCREVCGAGGACPNSFHCVTVLCLPDTGACSANGDCPGALCQCADPTCTARRCAPIDCGCQFNADGDDTCDGVLESGVDNVADSCGPAMACNGVGGCERALGQPCEIDAECSSGHCADGLCCAQACDGTCDRCGSDGLCVADPEQTCQGECAACVDGGDSFSCGPNHAVCEAMCGNTTCEAPAGIFACDLTNCSTCATSSAAAYTGFCGNGVGVLLPTGCVYSVRSGDFHTGVVEWLSIDMQCHDGVWVETFYDADADTCGACTPGQFDEWYDDCGGTSDHTLECPT